MFKCKKLFFLIYVFVGIIFFSCKISSADLFDYTIHIDKQTTDYNSARSEAIQDNREIALKKVIDKIIKISDYKMVDALIDKDTSYFFEQKLKISNESIESNLYSVDITYYFDKDKIIAFLSKNKIPYTLNLNNSILYIPIINHMIQQESLWYTIWSNINDGDYLTKVILPNDTFNINIDQLLTNNLDYIKQIKKEYNVENIVIASINDLTPDNIIDINTNTNNIGISATDLLKAPFNNLYGVFNLTLFDINKGEKQIYKNINSLYDAISLSIGFSEILIKEKAINSIEDKNSIIFKVNFDNFVDWINIYNALKSMNQVEEINVSEIGPNYYIIQLNFHGNIEGLINQAKARNIIIDNNALSIKCNVFCY